MSARGARRSSRSKARSSSRSVGLRSRSVASASMRNDGNTCQLRHNSWRGRSVRKDANCGIALAAFEATTTLSRITLQPGFRGYPFG
jgi:hypothetical protein